MTIISSLWATLTQTPLFWLALTLSIYQLMGQLYQRGQNHPLLNPVLWSITAIALLLRLTHTPYTTYLNGTQFIHFLLGPATVALALPLYQHYPKLKQMAWPILGALIIGSLTAITSAVIIGKLLGLSQITLLSLAPKSVTTPIAMGISEQVGGMPSLTAVFVIITGIIGAVSAKTLLDFMGIKDNSVRGFAIGLSSHGIGTARAFQLNEETGAFSGLGMGLNGLITAILVPILVGLLGLN